MLSGLINCELKSDIFVNKHVRVRVRVYKI